ncbi:hypothetical protein GY21_19645 [Cryobacterium roopkundense]|uniref:AB hydrolase-1 domain-containing protein n=1 Tax=Cryobacterium roopkundense TaxID=1001240 RepID=A0A099J0W5_9MICO|nr:hypothetical protein GY21_19645 [Cryobacterium roopkundense]
MRVAYDVVPGDRPVLLVHGFASTAADTWGVTGWVAFLADAGRGVITPDLRGHGRSDAPQRAAEYAPRQMAADLVAVLDDLELEQVDVIAYSLGSRVAAALTRLAPERVRRVVLGGAGPIEHFATWDPAAVERFVTDGQLPNDPTIAAVLGAAIAGGANRPALLACVQGMTGSVLDVPAGIPRFYVAGSADPIPEGVAELARTVGAEYLGLPGRTHMNALGSRAFKVAALDFLT